MRSKRLKVLRRKQRKATKMAPDRYQELFEEEKTQKENMEKISYQQIFVLVMTCLRCLEEVLKTSSA